jgi:hypothetical protein
MLPMCYPNWDIPRKILYVDRLVIWQQTRHLICGMIDPIAPLEEMLLHEILVHCPIPFQWDHLAQRNLVKILTLMLVEIPKILLTNADPLYMVSLSLVNLVHGSEFAFIEQGVQG